MNLPSSTADSFIKKLASDYPDFKFTAGEREHWSPRTATITYNPDHPARDLRYGVLHELAHAQLNHTAYGSDFELLKMESEAWRHAARIGRRYKVRISEDHIQNCLDTYRDWLHRRSKCPTCGAHALQKDPRHYQCFNCRTVWRVTPGEFRRPYRLTAFND